MAVHLRVGSIARSGWLSLTFGPENMKYATFKSAINVKLKKQPDGLTWEALRESLDLPYTKPCPEWIKQLERDIGLVRTKGSGRAYLWHLS